MVSCVTATGVKGRQNVEGLLRVNRLSLMDRIKQFPVTVVKQASGEW